MLVQLSFVKGQIWKILFWEALKNGMVSEKVAKWPFVVRKQVMWVKGTKMEQNERMVGLDLGIFI